MKKILIIVSLIIFISLITIANGKEIVNQDNAYITPGPNDVDIASHCIGIPLGKIILIKKNNGYGAIKITKSWTKRSSLFRKNYYDDYAMYESYYQEDGSGDFNKKNVIFFKGKTSDKVRFSLILLHDYEAGDPFVRCGPLELFCLTNTTGSNYLYHKLKINDQYGWEAKYDYDLELAPTKWTQISEVNVFDPRLKWFKYDEHRKDIVVPIDKLWEDTPVKQEPNLKKVEANGKTVDSSQ